MIQTLYRCITGKGMGNKSIEGLVQAYEYFLFGQFYSYNNLNIGCVRCSKDKIGPSERD